MFFGGGNPTGFLLLLVLLGLLIFEAAAASIKSVERESAGLIHHHLHNGHRHHHRHGHGHKSGADAGEDLTEALANLPVQASQLVVDFRAGKATSAAVLDELNNVYARGQANLDEAHFRCIDEELEVTETYRKARNDLLIAARAESQVEARISHLELTKNRILAELQSLREEFLRRRDSCASSTDEDEKAVKALEEDLVLATSIVETATKTCNFGGGTKVPLLECSMADGSSLVTFEDSALRSSASNLTALAKRLLSMQLERGVRSEVLAQAGASLFLEVNKSKHLGKHHFRGSKLGRKRHHHHIPARHDDPDAYELLDKGGRSKFSRAGDLPKDVCTAAVSPPCQSFADNLATFTGNLEDVLDELKARIGTAQTNCTIALNKYREGIEDLKAQADAASIEIASLLSEKERLLSERTAQKVHMENAEADKNRVKTGCESAKTVARSEMDAAIQLYNTLRVQGAFYGHCEVTEWAAGPCEGSCGSTGIRNLTRQVIRRWYSGTKCPNLEETRSCKIGACPIDGKMSRWGDWSQCSQACGGGTRSRYRKVTQWPSSEGLPVGETVQEEACNLQPCDADCALSKWSSWSSCSKVCGQGHEIRERKVVREAAGDGTCPSADGLREARPCNKILCNSTLVQKCNVTLDLVFAADVSGSVGNGAVAKINKFLQSFLSNLKVGSGTGDETGAAAEQQIGLMQYGASSTVLQVLTDAAKTFSNSANQLKWNAGPTQTGEALAVADDMFDWRSRQEADQAIVVITDGAPARASVLSQEAQRLKESGKRVIFIVVGPNLPRKTAIRWVSWPPQENLIVLPDYDTLATDQSALNLAATLCPSYSR